MTLDQGIRIPIRDLHTHMYWKNTIRLLVWSSVGADVEYGLWCMYGARMGCHMTNLSNWDYINVRDFEYLNKMWEDEVAPKFESFTSPTICTTTGYCWDNDKLKEEIVSLGNELRSHLDLDVADLFDETSSKFFRKIFKNPIRTERGIIDG